MLFKIGLQMLLLLIVAPITLILATIAVYLLTTYTAIAVVTFVVIMISCLVLGGIIEYKKALNVRFYTIKILNKYIIEWRDDL
ncbi:hypothetical protein [uncultured Clostridium sp.]|uniref:hypothetical protein n=1 Tax=uncultured Clostridium sp. TaxID=59620 RepID=UPI00321638FA